MLISLPGNILKRGHQHHLSLAFCWLKQNEAIRRIQLKLENLMEVNYLQYSYRSCHELHGRGGCSNWSPTANEICHSAPVVSRCAGWFIAQWYNKPTHEPSVLIWLPMELLHTFTAHRITVQANKSFKFLEAASRCFIPCYSFQHNWILDDVYTKTNISVYNCYILNTRRKAVNLSNKVHVVGGWHSCHDHCWSPECQWAASGPLDERYGCQWRRRWSTAPWVPRSSSLSDGTRYMMKECNQKAEKVHHASSCLFQARKTWQTRCKITCHDMRWYWDDTLFHCPTQSHSPGHTHSTRNPQQLRSILAVGRLVSQGTIVAHLQSKVAVAVCLHH